MAGCVFLWNGRWNVSGWGGVGWGGRKKEGGGERSEKKRSMDLLNREANDSGTF